MRKTQLVAGAFHQTVTKLTQGSPRRSLPNVIELPVQSSHCVSFSIDYFTLTKTIEFSFCLYTLSLHHLGQERDKKYFWYIGFYYFSKHVWLYWYTTQTWQQQHTTLKLSPEEYPPAVQWSLLEGDLFLAAPNSSASKRISYGATSIQWRWSLKGK